MSLLPITLRLSLTPRFIFQVEEEVFKKAYIPKRLTEVIDFERDINQVKSGGTQDLVYKTIVGLKSDLSGAAQKPEILETDNLNDASSSNSEHTSDEEHSSEDEESQFKDSSRPKYETLEEKKARKKAVKDAKAEKRKAKVKKHVKKRKEKGSKK